ncbi:MAG: hypothetical protein IJ809_02785 [Clostridia bacterium]|nr:hypothetical protein [Clostridia bacterium]
MLLDKIVTVALVVILDFLLFKKYVNGQSRLNLIAVIASIFGFSIYSYMSLKDVQIVWYFQIVLLVFMVLVPALMYFVFKVDRNKSVQNIVAKINRYIDEKKTQDARKLINKYLEENEESADTYIMLRKM